MPETNYSWIRRRLQLSWVTIYTTSYAAVVREPNQGRFLQLVKHFGFLRQEFVLSATGELW